MQFNWGCLITWGVLLLKQGSLVAQTKICVQCRRPRFNPWVRKIPWRREWQLTPVFLPREFRGQRSLAGYSLWGCKESDMTERLTLSLSQQFSPELSNIVFLFVGHLWTFIQIYLPLRIMMDDMSWWPTLDTMVNLRDLLLMCYL